MEFLSLKEGSTGSSESTLVKMPHCRKSHVAAQYHSVIVSHALVLLEHSKATDYFSGSNDHKAELGIANKTSRTSLLC